jgi:glyoxylase-like metal-dependent hydrolase (beta-lactamase superfamily II)
MSGTDETLPAPDVEPGGITEIADGVWIIPDRRVPLVPNVGVVLGEERVLVVDTGMGPANGRKVLEAARTLAGGRPLVLTLTHFHPEHGFGAQVFAGEAEVVYNRAQLDELRAKGEGYLGMFRTFGPAVEAALEGVELVDADETYEGSRHLDLGGRTVTLRETGLAHTRGDQLVTVDDEGVVFAGDLVEERCFPIFPYFPPDDVDVDGSAWIRVLAELEARGPRLVVPGHGAVGGPEVVAVQRAFMEELRAAAYAAADEGRSADETVAEREQGFVEAHPDWVQPEWVGFGLRCFHAERLTR